MSHVLLILLASVDAASAAARGGAVPGGQGIFSGLSGPMPRGQIEAAPPVPVDERLEGQWRPEADDLPRIERVSAPAEPSWVSPTPPTLSIRLRPAYRRMTLLPLLLNTGEVILRPVLPQMSDALVLVPALVLTGVAWTLDVPIHGAFRSWPDPDVLGQRWSYWGSYLGEGWVDVAIFALIGIAGGKKGERVCIAGLQALAATGIVSRVFKMLIRLERPSHDPENHHLWSERLSADAMPSGHTMAAFATAAVLAEEYPTLAPVFYGLAAYVGVARIQQSTHWMSDVIVGAALGTLFGWESVRLTRSYYLQPIAMNDGAGLGIFGTIF